MAVTYEWGTPSTENTVGSYSNAAGQFYFYGGLSPDTDNMYLKSVNVYVGATALATQGYAVAVYTGGDLDTNSLANATLVEQLPVLHPNSTEEWRTVNATGSVALPKSSTIWICLMVDDNPVDNFDMQGKYDDDLPAYDFHAAFRSFSITHAGGSDSNKDADGYSFPATILSTSATTNQPLPNLYLEYDVSIPTITTSVAGNNKPIEDRVSGLLTGIYSYTLLEGATLDSATFVQAGDIELTSGEGSVEVFGGAQSVSDPMILVIQDKLNGERIGAYEVVVSTLA